MDTLNHEISRFEADLKKLERENKILTKQLVEKTELYDLLIDN